jgi:hypothetical protein
MARPGPKSKYTADRVARILSLLEAGNTRGTSCRSAGISEDTFARWLARYADFADQVKEAESSAESRHVANIATAAEKGSWQASAWWLERRRWSDWGRKDRVEWLQSVREMARNSGADEELAVRQAEQILRELRSSRRA